jgi:Ca2+-binding RTX toxin-like protein
LARDDYNIGIANVLLTGLLVLDVDGGIGAASLHDLEVKHGLLSLTSWLDHERRHDVLIGRPNDSLTGGGGSDTFVFNPNFGNETIKDFDVNQDTSPLLRVYSRTALLRFSVRHITARREL